jgi:hypothetical protein
LVSIHRADHGDHDTADICAAIRPG